MKKVNEQNRMKKQRIKQKINEQLIDRLEETMDRDEKEMTYLKE